MHCQFKDVSPFCCNCVGSWHSELKPYTMANVCISLTVVVNFMMHTEFPTSCVSFHAILKLLNIFAVLACNPSPRWRRVAVVECTSIGRYKRHVPWHQLHCMAQGPVDSGDTVDRRNNATLQLQTNNGQRKCVELLLTVHHYNLDLQKRCQNPEQNLDTMCIKLHSLTHTT